MAMGRSHQWQWLGPVFWVIWLVDQNEPIFGDPVFHFFFFVVELLGEWLLKSPVTVQDRGSTLMLCS